jgi:hypothetical protein
MNKLLAALLTSAAMISGIGVMTLGTTNSAHATSITYRPLGYQLAIAQLMRFRQAAIIIDKPWIAPVLVKMDWQAPLVASGPVHSDLGTIVWDNPIQTA